MSIPLVGRWYSLEVMIDGTRGHPLPSDFQYACLPLLVFLFKYRHDWRAAGRSAALVTTPSGSWGLLLHRKPGHGEGREVTSNRTECWCTLSGGGKEDWMWQKELALSLRKEHNCCTDQATVNEHLSPSLLSWQVANSNPTPYYV
uniref:Uncharacterized protein n=1 Tax=Micrurus lemniscatus lemniscatus TaxID=129467 RepID=A0A2D4J0F8_MICLE